MSSEQSTRGMVFDIQRFCLHDGPGIRTTVFLKGCPLRCAWCANPESQRGAPELLWKRAGCVGCGACAAACPNGAVGLQDGAPRLDRARCNGCGACAEACPQRLATLKGWLGDAAAVMGKVARDKPFFDASGGGLTLSGGEPLAQPAFCKELLERAAKAGIHTCVESCLHVPGQNLRVAIELADTILFDIKHVDDPKHRRYTGQTSALVRQNAWELMNRRPDALPRVPVIPGFNDGAGDIRAIAELLYSIGCRRVQLMQFHSLAAAKYEALGREYAYKNTPHFTPAQWAGIEGAYRRQGLILVEPA